jgi:glucokinase
VNKKAFIGIDLGGTNIKIGLVDPMGQLLAEDEGPTVAIEGADAVLRRMSDMAKKIAGDHSYDWEEIAGVGVGIPGFLDIANGKVRLAANLGWHDIPVRNKMIGLLNKPVMIDNDANAAALGEAWIGAGAGVSHIVCITLGTGVGGGIIVNGEVYEGFRGMAGEIGHIPIIFGNDAVSCGCGGKGCLETVSSATGIVRTVRKRLQTGEVSTLNTLAEITAKDVFFAMQEGDKLALNVVLEAADVLGRSLATIAVILNPGRFVIGGGVARAGDLFFNPIRQAFAIHAPSDFVEGTDIVSAQLGNRAGVVGAAALVAKVK